MRFTALFTLAIALTGINADIVGFSGSDCDGDEGLNVPCDDSCHQFGNRHSFAVLVAGPRCVTVYEDTGCSIEVGAISNPGSGACSNVNTGTNVQSFQCSPNNVCE